MPRARRVRWIVCVLLLLACAHSPPDTRQPIDQTPEAIDLSVHWVGGLALVEANVEGIGPFHLVLDSGASFLALSPESVSRLSGDLGGLRIEEIESSAITPTGEFPLRERVTLPSLSLGESEAPEIHAWIVSMGWLERVCGTRIDGVLGTGMLGGVVVTIDYPRRRVSIAPGSLPVPDASSIFTYHGIVPSVPIQVGESTQLAVVDSGFSGFLSVPASMRRVLGFHSPPRPTRHRVTAGGVYVVGREGRLRQGIRVGRFSAPAPIVSLASSSKLRLGIEWLKNFRVSFDAANKRIRFERDDSGPVRCNPVRITGAGLTYSARGWTVAWVIPETPAAEAGLQEGDLVLTIEGHPAEDLTLDDRRALVDERTAIDLTIRRGERVIPIRLRVVVAVE